MVTLLMRTPELAVGEKMSMASVDQERRGQQEKAGAHHGEPKVASSELGRTRARKGRNAQKKQPQRGLGVAQLEKLRLQEQNKQEQAACFATLQGLPPSFGFTDQHGGICFRPVRTGAMPHQVSFGNGRATGPPSEKHYLAGGPRQQFGKGPVDGDAFRTIVSFANSDLSSAGSFARHGHTHGHTHGQGSPSVALMLPHSRESMEHSYACSSMRTVPSLASLSERPGSNNNKGQGSCGTSAYAEEQLPPNSTAHKSSAFSNGINLVDSLASNVNVEPEADRESVVHKFQVSDAGMLDTKLFPAFGKNGAAGSPFSSNSRQCFESSSGPANSCPLPHQDRSELPVVGLAINFGRPKELSSFQSFSSNNTWLATEKTCGLKRPWDDLKVNTSKSMHFESLDLNAPAGEIEVAQGRCNAGVTLGGAESPEGGHDTPGVSRSGLGYTLPLLKDKACASWQETEVQNLSTTTDVGFHSGESFLKVGCAPQSRIKDCCSSVCSPCGSPVTRQRCLSSPEVPVLMGLEHDASGDFLTLEIPSRSYPMNLQYGVEVNSKESMSPDMGYQQLKRARISEVEVDNSLHLQMSNRHQESAPSVTGGGYSPSRTDNSFFSAVALSCRFTSTSSSNITEDCHKQTGREERREFLDLRLRLAL